MVQSDKQHNDPMTAARKTSLAWLRINKAALSENMRLLRSCAGANSQLTPVLKADCYGLGMIALAETFWTQGARLFYVAQFDEGLALKAQLPQARVAVLSGMVACSAQDFWQAGLEPVLNSFAQVKAYLEASIAQEKSLPSLCIQIDTGMNRLGLDVSEQQCLLELDLQQHQVVLLSHYACADTPEHPMNKQQEQNFARFAEQLALKVKKLERSMANSAALVSRRPSAHFEHVRPGLSLYGAKPFSALADNKACPIQLQVLAQLEARILQLRAIRKGQCVGYGANFVAPCDMRIATLGLGYADGWLRAAQDQGQQPARFVRINGQQAPLLGRVSMDSMAVDVTHIAGLHEGSVVQMFGQAGDIEQLAHKSNTIAYEWMTSFGQRYERIYEHSPQGLVE